MNGNSNSYLDALSAESTRGFWAVVGSIVLLSIMCLTFAWWVAVNNHEDWRCIRAGYTAYPVQIPGQKPYLTAGVKCLAQVNLVTGQTREVNMDKVER